MSGKPRCLRPGPKRGNGRRAAQVTVTDRDIWAVASLYVTRYGDDAVTHARARLSCLRPATTTGKP
jgi:hypothetical protein